MRHGVMAMGTCAWVACFWGTAWASPLGAGGPALGARTVAVNPAINVDLEGTVESGLYLTGGLREEIDLTIGAAWALGADGTVVPGAVEIMPRWFVHESVGLGLYTSWAPGEDEAVVGPQVHLNGAWGSVGVFGDFAWSPVVGRATGVGAVSVNLAAELSLFRSLSTFLEASGELDLQTLESAVAVTPGFSLVLDRDGRHEMAAGLRVPVGRARQGPVGNPGYSVGVWYSVAFDVGRRG